MQMEEKYELESENERKRQEEIDDRIGAALREIYNKTSTLSNFSRINLMNREVCDLVSIIDDLLIRYSSHKRYKDIDWEPEKSSIKVLGDENLLLTGLMNILENALRYSEENSKVKIKTEIEGDTVVLKFINQKAPDNHEPQLKLESARNVTLNSGIGLMLSERIIRSHGGELEVNMQDNEVEIVIRLRLMEKP
jgi:signal transduction histidine kinase